MREEIYQETNKLLQYLSAFALANTLSGLELTDSLTLNYVADFEDRTLTIDIIHEKAVKMKVKYVYKVNGRRETELFKFNYIKEHFNLGVAQYHQVKKTMYFMTDNINSLNLLINYLVEDEL